MEYKIEYFERKEFICPCCGEGGVSEALVLRLDLLRRAWGGPVGVNSGRRCIARNAEVGGSRRSRHLIGCAADIRIAGTRIADTRIAGTAGLRAREAGLAWSEFAALASRLCRLPGWEFRLYDSFIHIAVPREESAKLWEGAVVVS
jgi:hypothetical protein